VNFRLKAAKRGIAEKAVPRFTYRSTSPWPVSPPTPLSQVNQLNYVPSIGDVKKPPDRGMAKGLEGLKVSSAPTLTIGMVQCTMIMYQAPSLFNGPELTLK